MRGTELERVRRLAEAVQTSAEAHRDTLASRNAAIADAQAAGYTFAQIGKAAGLSRPTVLEILAAQDVARAVAG